MSRAAVIDIGSNSTKLVIGEKKDEGLHVLESLKNVIAIGKSTFYNGNISQEIFTQVIGVLENYKKVIAGYDIKDIKVIATTAVREAGNRDIFLDTVRRKTGLDIEVLNVGDVVYYIDAFLSFKLIQAYPVHEKNILIVELGAGSFDVSLMEKGFTLMNVGIPIGTLRLKQFKDRIDASRQEVLEALEEYVENEIADLKRMLADIRLDDIILIDDSYAPIIHALLQSKVNETHFFPLKFSDSRRFLSLVTSRRLNDQPHSPKIPMDLYDSLDGYAMILHKLYKLVKSRSLYILQASLSEALLVNMIFGVEVARKYNKANQLVSVAKFLCRKYDTDIKHARHVAFIAEELFKGLKSVLGLQDEDWLYLEMASYLHNLGSFISNRSYHKHSEYIINALNLFRLTEPQIRTIACIARYHRKAPPQRTHPFYNSLDAADQIRVQKLSSLLRMAHALDSSKKQKVKKIEFVFNQLQEIILNVYMQESFALEKVDFQDMKKMFEEISGNRITLAVKKKV